MSEEDDIKKREILEWLKENFTGNFSVDFTPENEIIINGNIRLNNHKMTRLKFPFAEINGDFKIGGDLFPGEGLVPYRSLNTLENCPRIVRGDFWCNMNQDLKSLKGGPIKVGRRYRCNNCDLENLDGIAQEIGTWVTAFANHRLRDISALDNVVIHKTCDFEFADEALFQTETYKKLLEMHKVYIAPPIRWD